jgi:hypothetical protein
MLMPLTTGSLTAARFPNSSAKPIWCLVRGRSTAPRGAKDTLVTLSTSRPVRTNTLLISLLPLAADRAAKPPTSMSFADEKRVGPVLLSTATRDPVFDCSLPLAADRAAKPPTSSSFADEKRVGSLLLSTATRDPMFDCSLRSLFGLWLTTG